MNNTASSAENKQKIKAPGNSLRTTLTATLTGLRQTLLNIIFVILRPLQLVPPNVKALDYVLGGVAKKNFIPEVIFNIMRSALKNSDKRIDQIMVQRIDMASVNMEDSMQNWVATIMNSKHSRYPVYLKSIDNIKGILLSKDLLPYMSGGSDIDLTTIKKIIRPANTIPENSTVHTVLKKFLKDRAHMAIVVDEYASVVGLVTLEDVIEEIIGEIEDEHDEYNVHQKKITLLTHNKWNVDALIPLDELNRHIDSTINHTEMKTLGGWLTQKLGHVPKTNDTFREGDLTFLIDTTTPRRAVTIVITRESKKQAVSRKVKSN